MYVQCELWVRLWAAYRHALEKADVEADPANTAQGCEHAVVVLVVGGEFKERHSLVPFHRCPNDLDKRQGDLGVPLLGRLRVLRHAFLSSLYYQILCVLMCGVLHGTTPPF